MSQQRHKLHCARPARQSHRYLAGQVVLGVRSQVGIALQLLHMMSSLRQALLACAGLWLPILPQAHADHIWHRLALNTRG